jgi:lipopolysaccharide export system permease protein
MTASHHAPLPVLNRYLISQFLTIFIAVTFGFILLYIVIDLFDRLDILLRHRASVGAASRYFLFKIPLMLTQITPPAVIVSVLLSLGLLSRRNEVIALRAGGISLLQTAFPLLWIALGICVFMLTWNETVVPYCSRRFQHVNNSEIRKRRVRGILSDREIWYHGRAGFYNIDYVDRGRQAVFGLMIYRLDDHFRLESVVRVPEAYWRHGRWLTAAGVRYRFDESTLVEPVGRNEISIPETLDDFLEVQREPEELSYSSLRERIRDLTEKGIDASHYLVDLQLKLAVPFASFALAFVAIPIAGRLRRHPSIASIIGLGMGVGFFYWVLLGLATSLGQNGAIPPVPAAWSANVVFVLLGVLLFLSSE